MGLGVWARVCGCGFGCVGVDEDVGVGVGEDVGEDVGEVVGEDVGFK